MFKFSNGLKVKWFNSGAGTSYDRHKQYLDVNIFGTSSAHVCASSEYGYGPNTGGTKTNSWSCFGLESTIHFFGVHDFDPCDSILSYYVNVKSNFQTQSDEHDTGPVKLS